MDHVILDVDDITLKRLFPDFYTEGLALIRSGRSDDSETQSPVAEIGNDAQVSGTRFTEKNRRLRGSIANIASLLRAHKVSIRDKDLSTGAAQNTAPRATNNIP